MRTPLIAGNWKMHLARQPAGALARDVAALVRDVPGVDVALCPPATALDAVGRALAGTRVLLGAQTMHWEAQGPYTGEISAPMLVDLGCKTVIVGHSERRIFFGELDTAVGLKAAAAIAHGLTPIVCVGEAFSERGRGETAAVIARQLGAVLALVPAAAVAGLVVAYEPVWAIGSGLTPTGPEVDQVAALIRARLAAAGGAEAAGAARVLYGGSVKPENIGVFLEQPEIDGALVGGASLDASAFGAIVRAAAR